ncbi:ABC transporter substrate-binding protein [Carbonactinospora thermoautotrophica]|uniref:ABC transporter substrate-binding protein n=1 Tax=Carbonactinospora thermoautotrophica TaxID=1469144 RepID=A0A132MQW9_9ACTN|nr:metal ABC transporter substrate-binding protein [Carbonactinospora thermoautotrophica]KWX00120.1 ABC transporter substrate-binding protein [Carbonactinospora thermoautotrophica]
MLLRRALPTALLASLAALAAPTLTGCTGSSADPGEGPKVVVGFYPFEFLTRRIGGDAVTVTNLTKPGTEPHDLELTPRQVGEVAEASLVIYLKGMQPALDKAIEQNKPPAQLDVTRVVPLESHEEAGDDHGHDDQPGHEHSPGHAEEHEHGGPDPHVWLDPQRFAKVAIAVGDQLAQIDTARADDYRARAAQLARQLQALDGEFSAGLKNCERRDIVTTHAAFGYLTERYRLNQIAINGLSPEAEPSPAHIARIQELIREKGITTIFFETLASPKTAQMLADDLHLKTAVLDPVEGVKDQKSQDYFSVMRANLTELRKALSCS